DTINHFGEKPANFLHVGGGATAGKATDAFKIILGDQGVKGIIVNINGGIMQWDIIAQRVVEAVENVGHDITLLVRREGTSVDEGKKILKDSGLDITPATTMAEGAQKIIAAVEENK